MTDAQLAAAAAHLGTDSQLLYVDNGRVCHLLRGATDVTVTPAGNVRLGCRTLVRPDGTTAPIR